MSMSAIRPFSLGIVAEVKPLGERDLMVTPIEHMPALDGEIRFNPETSTVGGTDAYGNRYEVTVTTNLTLPAEWLPYGSNRVTPPDMQPGELVEILRLADSDRYFWRSLGLRDNLRRLETVIYAFCANASLTDDEVNLDNSYFFEICTRSGKITLGTSKKNGEPFAYTLQLNSMGGKFILEDDADNYFEFDSNIPGFVYKNNLNTRLEVNRTHIDLDAKTVTVKGSQQIQLQSGGTSLTLVPAGATLRAPFFAGVRS